MKTDGALWAAISLVTSPLAPGPASPTSEHRGDMMTAGVAQRGVSLVALTTLLTGCFVAGVNPQSAPLSPNL